MHKEDLEVLRLDAHVATPRNLALLHHLHRIDVDESRPGGQQQHALAREQPFALVDEALLEDDLVVDELVPLVVGALRLDALLAHAGRYVQDICGVITKQKNSRVSLKEPEMMMVTHILSSVRSPAQITKDLWRQQCMAQ